MAPSQHKDELEQDNLLATNGSSVDTNKVQFISTSEPHGSKPDPPSEYIYRWGYGSFKPSALQYCNNSKILLACLTLIGLALGAVVNGLVPISITTLERRFDLTSTDSGMFAGAYKLASMISLIPIAHFSSKGNKGRYLSYGAFSLGLGSLICTLPQFISPPYQYESASDSAGVCQAANESTTVEEQPTVSLAMERFYYYLLLCGQLFHGIGGAPIVLLAVTYMDENVSQMASPIYSSVFMLSRNILGPALGYVTGGFALSVYGDFLKVDMVDMHMTGAKDPRWYGAWWLGFAICGFLSMMLSIPILGFPKRLPEAHRHRLKDVDQSMHRRESRYAESDGEGEVKKVGGTGFTEDLSSLPHSIWKCLQNTTFTAIILAQMTEAFMLSALLSFTPKILENVFSVNSSQSSFISGGILVVGGVSGTLFGGFIIRKLRLHCKGILSLCLTTFIITLPLFGTFFLRCEQAPFAPLQAQCVTSINQSINARSSCTSNCHCSTTFYNPVCDQSTNTIYFSACHAGCEQSLDEGKTFSSCSCLLSNITTSSLSPSPSDGTVVRGICSIPCPVNFPVFLVVYTGYLFVIASAFVPIQQAVLRSVKFERRTLAFGLLLLADGMGTILGSVSLGAAFDTQCTIWKESASGGRSCVHYESINITYMIMIFGVATKCIGIALLAYARLHYRRPPPAKEVEMEEIVLNKP